MSDGINKFVEGVGKAVETVPELYDDGFKPVTQETGKTIALIPRTINAALSPLRQWIAQREYNVAETEKLLAKKLEDIDADKIVTPEPYVAVPALQAISYTMDSNELRELYANLLAKSMNADTKTSVHPAFIETIKQLSPDDARYFKHICPLDVRPMVSAVLDIPGGLIYTVASWINKFSKGYTNNMSLSIDNLSRLGLINIPTDMWYGDNSYYTDLIESAKNLYPFENYKNKFPTAIKMDYPKSRIDITNYGRAFYDICVKD